MPAARCRLQPSGLPDFVESVALDPISPQTKTSLAFVLSNARRYEEATEVQKAAAGGGIRRLARRPAINNLILRIEIPDR